MNDIKTRRRDLLSVVLLGAVDAAYGQAKTAKRRLGVLWHERQESYDARELLTALAELGWVVGRNLAIEWYFANGDQTRLPALAAEIVRSKPDAVLTYFAPPTVALQRATTTIPIVTSVGDPVGFGFTRSYARPDGNITGLSLGLVESQRKSIELLRAAAPAVKRLILAVNMIRAQDVEIMTRSTVSAAREVGIGTEIAMVGTTKDLQAALRSDGTVAISPYGFDVPSSSIKVGEVIALALSKNVATVGSNAESVALGALLSYNLYWDNNRQRTAAQLDKILRGVSPAQIPFELPSRSWLAVNLKTARALGLVLPNALLARADEILE